jgi:hypothetical protein
MLALRDSIRCHIYNKAHEEIAVCEIGDADKRTYSGPRAVFEIKGE